jgi:hypothetical protein
MIELHTASGSCMEVTEETVKSEIVHRKEMQEKTHDICTRRETLNSCLLIHYIHDLI